MKREHQKTHEFLYRHFALFVWKKCECCGDEFNRERGWRYLSGPFYGGAGKWKYLCGLCAKNTVQATHLIETIGKRRPAKPPPPPSPPRISL